MSYKFSSYDRRVMFDISLVSQRIFSETCDSAKKIFRIFSADPFISNITQYLYFENKLTNWLENILYLESKNWWRQAKSGVLWLDIHEILRFLSSFSSWKAFSQLDKSIRFRIGRSYNFTLPPTSLNEHLKIPPRLSVVELTNLLTFLIHSLCYFET